MNILHLRCLVAAGAAALVMGLGGNLYATSYPMPDKFDFGTGPPWALAKSDVATSILAGDHGSYNRTSFAVVLDHFRQTAALEAKVLKHHGRSERSDRWETKNAHVQTVMPVVTVPVDTPTSVPDAGSTLLLLGGALCGLVVLRGKHQA